MTQNIKTGQEKDLHHEREKTTLTVTYCHLQQNFFLPWNRRKPSRFIIRSIECFDINTIDKVEKKNVSVISKYGSKKELILISFDFLQLMQIITITTTKYMKNGSFSRCESWCFLVASMA